MVSEVKVWSKKVQNKMPPGAPKRQVPLAEASGEKRNVQWSKGEEVKLTYRDTLDGPEGGGFAISMVGLP